VENSPDEAGCLDRYVVGDFCSFNPHADSHFGRPEIFKYKSICILCIEFYSLVVLDGLHIIIESIYHVKFCFRMRLFCFYELVCFRWVRCQRSNLSVHQAIYLQRVKYWPKFCTVGNASIVIETWDFFGLFLCTDLFIITFI